MPYGSGSGGGPGTDFYGFWAPKREGFLMVNLVKKEQGAININTSIY